MPHVLGITAGQRLAGKERDVTRVDRYGDEVEDAAVEVADISHLIPPTRAPAARGPLNDSSFPLAELIADLGGTCPTCTRFVCTCESQR